MARDGRRPARMATAALTATLAGCIIPDSGILVRGDFVNRGPVRIVEAVPLSDQANDACEQVSPVFDGCPILPESVPLGLLGAESPFCVCPEGDENALFSFDVYVEDPDLDDDGNPADTILGVFLLDLPEGADDPSMYVAYTNLLSGSEPASPVQLGIGGYPDSLERPRPLVRSWTLGRDARIDLCNDNSGMPVSLGVHSLRLVVTDRPWYRPLLFGPDGKPLLDAADVPMRVEDESLAKIGVADTPAGASYAIADYVFACRDGDDEDAGCNCAIPEMK